MYEIRSIKKNNRSPHLTFKMRLTVYSYRFTVFYRKSPGDSRKAQGISYKTR